MENAGLGVLLFQLLFHIGIATSNGLPDRVDFFHDPLIPRINDTLVFDAEFAMDSQKFPPKDEDHRWYYRDQFSSVRDYRLIGYGRSFNYKLAPNYRDGYFKLSVLFCCDNSRKLVKLESEKLIRAQRPIKVKVLLNGNVLPGNLSVSSIMLADPLVDIECRITGMPMQFSLHPPLGVTCERSRVRNKRRYLAVIRRRCSFSPGTYKCVASNDLSHVIMLHHVQDVIPATRSSVSRKSEGNRIYIGYNKKRQRQKERNRKRKRKEKAFVYKKPDIVSNEQMNNDRSTTVKSEEEDKPWFVPISNSKRNKAITQHCNTSLLTLLIVQTLLYVMVRH